MIEKKYEVRFSIDDLKAQSTSGFASKINNHQSKINNRTS